MTSITPTAAIISTSNNPPTPAPPITAILTSESVSAMIQHVVGKELTLIESVSGSEEPANEEPANEESVNEELGNEELGNEESGYEVREELAVVTLS